MDGMEIGEICTTITNNSGNDKIAEMINLLRLCFNSCFLRFDCAFDEVLVSASYPIF